MQTKFHQIEINETIPIDSLEPIYQNNYVTPGVIYFTIFLMRFMMLFYIITLPIVVQINNKNNPKIIPITLITLFLINLFFIFCTYESIENPHPKFYPKFYLYKKFTNYCLEIVKRNSKIKFINLLKIDCDCTYDIEKFHSNIDISNIPKNKLSLVLIKYKYIYGDLNSKEYFENKEKIFLDNIKSESIINPSEKITTRLDDVSEYILVYPNNGNQIIYNQLFQFIVAILFLDIFYYLILYFSAEYYEVTVIKKIYKELI